MTRGTLKRPASGAASGALRIKSWRDKVGCGSSSRSTGRLRTCEVGATPEVSRVADLFDVRQDVAELPREQLELVGAQLETGQFRDALHIFAFQGGHDPTDISK